MVCSRWKASYQLRRTDNCSGSFEPRHKLGVDSLGSRQVSPYRASFGSPPQPLPRLGVSNDFLLARCRLQNVLY